MAITSDENGDAIPDVDPSILHAIMELVHVRIKHINDDDRRLLDLTYCPACLNLRNEYNRHDYDWYMDLIESGFGVNAERIDVVPVNGSTTLPFPGMITYPSIPHYEVFLTTVTGRHTMWLVRFSTDGPKVIVPAFHGAVADSVALGTYPWSLTNEPFNGPSTIVEFHQEDVVENLAKDIAFRLKSVWHRHKFDTLRAMTLDCHPWDPVLSICLLTTQEGEEFQEAKYGKWDIAAWRLFHVADLDRKLQRLIYDYCLGRTIAAAEIDGEARVDLILQCCAMALKHDLVRASVQRFQLASDFEVAIFHPDDGQNSRDYCQLAGR